MYGMKGGDANRQSPKKIGKNKFAHTPDTQIGMGDNYGSGVRNPMGRMREDSMGMNDVVPKRLKIPPRSLT